MIGAGALGLAVALRCALDGRSVVVVERRTPGSQASGRAAGLFKSVQADELRTVLARRSIDLAISFGDWAGVPLPVARSGSFLIARTRGGIRGSSGPRPASPAAGACSCARRRRRELADRVSYYRGSADELAIWCPEDVYIEEPMSLVRRSSPPAAGTAPRCSRTRR